MDLKRTNTGQHTPESKLFASDPAVEACAVNELYPRLCEIGEVGLAVEFGAAPTPAVRAQVLGLLDNLNAAPFTGLLEAVAGYTTVTVYAEPLHWDAERLKTELLRRLKVAAAPQQAGGRELVIPVCYEGEYAPDLAFVAKYTGLSPADVIALHTGGTYPVHLIGFAPGFAYLGGLPPRLQVPRKASPRLRVEAGSVALAGMQTGIYPFVMPGGWQVIGCTRTPLFDARATPPGLLRPGDTVHFQAVSSETLLAGPTQGEVRG